jgi:rubredoxin
MLCGYVYSVENNETDYENVMDMLPEDFACPGCGAPKSAFEPVKED